MACVQRGASHTYSDYFSAVYWFISQLNQIVLDLFWGLVHALLFLGFWAAVLAVTAVVLYANFGQRLPRPSMRDLVVAHAANPELYE